MSVAEDEFIKSIFSPTSRRTTFMPKTPIPTSQSRYSAASSMPMAVSQSRYTADSSRPTFMPKTPIPTSQSRYSAASSMPMDVSQSRYTAAASSSSSSSSRPRPFMPKTPIPKTQSRYSAASSIPMPMDTRPQRPRPRPSSRSRSPTRDSGVSVNQSTKHKRDLWQEKSSEEESSEEESSEEESSEEEEKKKEFRRKYMPNQEIYSTSFSYGLEYEPSSLQYYDHNQGHHYDRELIYNEVENLKVTIEEIDLDKKFGNKDKEKALSCKYNLEIDIGPFPFDNISNFLSEINKEKSREEYVEKTLVPILNSFKEYINEENQDYLRFMKKAKLKDKRLINFQDCAMSISEATRRKYDNSLSIFYYSMLNNTKRITGRPQITIGISYAFLPYLASYYITIGQYDYLQEIFNDYHRFVDSNQDLFGDLSQSSLDVFKGFVFLILYTSNRRISYVSKAAGGTSSYIKSIFPMKPRTNLALSYTYLVRDYPELGEKNKLSIFKVKIDENLDRMREELNGLFGVNIERFNYTGVKVSTEENDSIAMTDIVNYKMDMLNVIASKLSNIGDNKLNEILQKSEEYGKEEYPDDHTSEFLIRLQFISGYIKRLPNGRKILNYFMYLDSSILLYDIFNPVKSVKVYILDKNKFGKKICQSNKILDGYLYSYIDGRDKDLIDQLVREDFIRIQGPYDYAGQPPLLFPVKKHRKTYICTNFRQELFEWIPADSNLVIELRGPEKLTHSSEFKGSEGSSVKLIELPKFYREMFEGLNNALKPII